jgi:putative peptidoglycan lipid II flippase
VTGVEIDRPRATGRPKGRLAGATAGMAVGTTISRITGVGRIVALASALGGAGFADAYNLANTTPNIIYDVVLGGVLSATFVPVFVDHLTTRRGKDAWDAISAVVTVTVTVLVAATVAFFLLTPGIIGIYTGTSHHADVHQQQQVAIALLRWFVPQLAFYGLISLFTALLNARGKFALPMFVPIANNLVVIVVLLWFHHLVPHPTLASIYANHRGLVLLGVGTTLGVVVQATLLIPSLLRADLHVRFLWNPAHEAMRRITRLAGWTFGWVVSSQVVFVIVLSLADGAKVAGGVSAYTYAYAFFQLPYGVVAVSVMTAVTPSLSARWAKRDIPAFRHRMAFGLRGMLAIVIPSAVGMLILSHPLIDLVLLHAAETPAAADSTAATLAMFSLGLPGFCTFLYAVRIFQSMQDTRTAFKLYLVNNAVTIVFAFLLVGSLGVRGLALAVSIGYSVGALLALSVIRQRVGGLGGDDLTTPVKRVLGASGVMGVATVLAVNVSGATSGFRLLARVLLALVIGALAYGATAGLLGAREARRAVADRTRRAAAPAGSSDAPAANDPRPPANPSLEPFHDRLGDRLVDLPYRHLRPVINEREDEPVPVDEHQPGVEEDFDGPNSGGN